MRDPNAEHLAVGDLQLHLTKPELSVNGAEIILTPIQHRLLLYLMSHAGQPMSIDQLLEDVWEYPPGTGDPKLVRVHVKNLRNKIEPVPDNPQYIVNVRGRGYIIHT